MSAKIGIQEPVLDSALRSINYFTGRLLTANDLNREKLAQHEADWRLGRAIGDGVAYGLEVSIAPESQPSAPVLRIEPGLAVNCSGQTLALRNPVELQLVKPIVTGVGNASIFGECQP